MIHANAGLRLKVLGAMPMAAKAFTVPPAVPDIAAAITPLAQGFISCP
jgi:hypothetical protein